MLSINRNITSSRLLCFKHFVDFFDAVSNFCVQLLVCELVMFIPTESNGMPHNPLYRIGITYISRIFRRMRVYWYSVDLLVGFMTNVSFKFSSDRMMSIRSSVCPLVQTTLVLLLTANQKHEPSRCIISVQLYLRESVSAF